jgi:molybdopterin-guanine dinucleotide biosynthesis protein A
VADSDSIAPLLGLVLAGGRSERFGRDKAAVLHAGESLLSRAVTTLSAVVPRVYVASREEQLRDESRRPFRLIADRQRGIGPAAGILAAHEAEPGAAWLVIACDMPRLDAATLRWLVERRDAGREATALRSAADGRPEPLCAIYEPATLARFHRQVGQGGDPSARSWLAAADALLLDPPQPDVLVNVNTPEDLARIR